MIVKDIIELVSKHESIAIIEDDNIVYTNHSDYQDETYNLITKIPVNLLLRKVRNIDVTLDCQLVIVVENQFYCEEGE